MKAYIGTFIKKNGEERTMKFVRLEDLPEKFITSKVKNTGTKRNLKEGLELVWDTDQSEFRVFNWSTTRGDIDETEIDDIY
jgi:hypothetical protein|tara:strand:- start:1642 stop:1884 length:243 start_codon:yes stop_codon:yes gene_type:complete